MQGGDLFSYDMVVMEDENEDGLFRGSVKTYATKSQEVVADIELRVDKVGKKVNLRETKITSNTGFKSNTIICLVRADLNFDEVNGVLKGPIETQTTGDQAYCARGNVIFTNRNEIEALFGTKQQIIKATEPIVVVEKKIEPKPTKSNPTIRKTDPVSQPIISSKPADKPIKKPMEITEGKDQAINWDSKIAIFEIWDDNYVDGDKVTITANGATIVENYTLTKEPAQFKIDISNNELSVITIKAMSEGNQPPNTAMIKLTDDTKNHYIWSHNDVGKTSIIRIKRKL